MKLRFFLGSLVIVLAVFVAWPLRVNADVCVGNEKPLVGYNTFSDCRSAPGVFDPQWYATQQVNCCIAGGQCVLKRFDYPPTTTCGISDFFNVSGSESASFTFQTFPAVNGLRQTPTNYCVCQNKALACDEKDSILVAGRTERFTCSPETPATDPHDCSNHCTSIGSVMLACGGDKSVVDSQINVSLQKTVGAGKGCLPTHCWCQNLAGKYCSHHTQDENGAYFATQPACDEFCGKKNTPTETGWKSIHFDPSYTNYYDPQYPAPKGCNFGGGTGVQVSPNDFTGNIRADAAKLNQLTAFSGPAEFIGNGIRVLMLFIGSIVLVMYIYGGLMWMTAAGNTEQISKSKQILVYSTLGVVAMLGSYMLVQFVFGTLLQLKT